MGGWPASLQIDIEVSPWKLMPYGEIDTRADDQANQIQCPPAAFRPITLEQRAALFRVVQVTCISICCGRADR